MTFTVACGICAAQPGEDCIWRDAEGKPMKCDLAHAKRIEAQAFLDGMNCPSIPDRVIDAAADKFV